MIVEDNDNKVLTIQRMLGAGSDYLWLRMLTAIGTACVFVVAVTIGFNHFGFHYSLLFFAWTLTAAIVFRLVARLMNLYNKVGWVLLIIAIVFFAVAYYFVLLNILPDPGPDFSDVF